MICSWKRQNWNVFFRGVKKLWAVCFCGDPYQMMWVIIAIGSIVCIGFLYYSETCIKRPRVGQKKWSLYYRGGLLKGAKIYAMTAIGT